MNRSWRNTSSNASTGFVYFKTNTPAQSPVSQKSCDSSDFLSFGSDSPSEGSPHGQQFTPRDYSSPNKYYSGKSPRQRGNRTQYYSPIKQTGGHFWRRNSGLSGPNELNISSSNTSGNTFQKFGDYQSNYNRHNHNRHRGKFTNKTPNQSFTASAFYDPKCLEDPWAELEKKLAEDRRNDTINLDESESSQNKSNSIDVDEASSGQNGSDDDSEEMEESFS